MSFHPHKVRTPTASLLRLFDGKILAWSPMARVDHILEMAGLRLLDSRMFRGTRHFLVLSPENVVHRFRGFENLEAYALGLVHGRDLAKCRQ
jgi:hypothetical protein